MESYQEKAETLSKRFGISPIDAMKALEESDGDILDAVSLLEAQGIIKRTSASFTTADKTRKAGSAYNNIPKSAPQPESELKKSLNSVLNYGLDNRFVVSRSGKRLVEMPILLLIILLILCFWITLPLMIVGLFIGCRYHFEGTGADHSEINSAMNKVSEGAEKLKNKYR